MKLNIIGVWEWGIYGLMGGAFMTKWTGHLSLNGKGIYHLMGRAFITKWAGHLSLNGLDIYH